MEEACRDAAAMVVMRWVTDLLGRGGNDGGPYWGGVDSRAEIRVWAEFICYTGRVQCCRD
jgi:hypothetical protein